MVIEYKIKFEGNSVVVTQTMDASLGDSAAEIPGLRVSGHIPPPPPPPVGEGNTTPPGTGEKPKQPPTPVVEGNTSPPGTGEMRHPCGLTIVFGQTVIAYPSHLPPPRPGDPIEASRAKHYPERFGQ